MATIYLTEQGSVLKKTYKRILIEKDGEKLLELPEFKVDRILIFGNVHITTPAINFLLDNGIDTSFLSLKGKFRGRLAPVESKNIYLRMAQFKKYQDNNFKINFGKIIVERKIKNFIFILHRYLRNHPEIDLSFYLFSLKKNLNSLARKESLSSIRGVEGKSSAIYFEALGRMFRGGLQFTKRSKNPPTDPINSLLSLGYILITNELFSLLCATGFDAYLGYLHEIDYGRPSLALDLVEEFRQPVIDTFTLSLINKKVLNENDFEKRANQGCYLREEAQKKYFRHYEKMLTKENNHWRKIFQRQVQKLAEAILKENITYKPYAREK